MPENKNELIKNEDRIYVSPYASDPLFDIPVAGISYPNPLYKKRRDEPMDTYVFEYVIRGGGYLCAGGETVELRERDLYIINTKYPQCYYSDRGDPFEKIWVNATGKLLCALFGVYLPERTHYVRHGCDAAYPLLERIHRVLLDTGATRSEALERSSLLIHELVLLMREAYITSGGGSAAAVSACRKEAAIRDYLDRSVYSEISLDDISERYFISRNHIIRLFSKEYGVTPMRYLMRKRLDICDTLLAETDLNLAQISSMLRFSSPQHLSSAYKRERGYNMSDKRH